MVYEGQIVKMVTIIGEPITYWLPIGGQRVAMNDFMGKRITLKFLDLITCINCGRSTKKSFNQGFCYPCMRDAPEASECIIRPELCRGHLGEGRNSEWEQKHHVQDHYVYLAVSSAVKVGITRSTQVPTRWIDQGASYAMKLAKTPNRYLAGAIEVALKQHMTDKTNWRKMLKNEVLEDVDLHAVRRDVMGLVAEDLKQYFLEDDKVVRLNFPVVAYPEKVKSLGFDKVSLIEGILKGIKGQYLIFDGSRVLNIRKHNGYHISLEA